MCLYPKLIKNRKYTATKKNKGEIPTLKDDRTLWVPIGCGKCIECTKQRANHWRTRLLEEIRHKRLGAQFVTLTFSPDKLEHLSKDILNKNSEYEIDNEIAALATRRFLVRCFDLLELLVRRSGLS